MNASVIIVTYNRLELLKECVLAVQNQTKSFHHIIVINNASTDGTEEYLKQYRFHQDFVIHNADCNQGGAYGFRKGMEIARDLKDDWILLIDDDAILESRYFEYIYDEIEKDEGKYEAYAGVVQTEGMICLSHRRRHSSQYYYKPRAIREEEYQKPDFICDLASFCGLLVSSVLVEKIGLPLSEYFIWYDDSEYCMRINQFSKIKNINNSILNHKTTILDNTVSWKTYYGMRNRIHLTIRYYGHSGLINILIRTYGAMVIDIVKSSLRKRSLNIFSVMRVYHLAVKSGLKGELGKNELYLPGREI